MKNEILEEINRMKVLGGILSEAAGPTQVLPRVIATLSRTALDDAILSAFASLENKGLITINKTTKAITKVNWNILSPDELKLLFSAEPVRKIFLDATTDLGVDITSSAQRASFIGKPFGKILKGYDDAANSIISTGGSSAGGRAGSNAMSDPIDSIINRLDDIDIDELDVNEIIRRNVSNPRFQEYRVILRGIPMTDEVRNMMLAAYDIIGKDPVKAIEYASKLQSKLNEKQYGWVKRGINQATKNPTKTITILGKTIAAGTFWGITAFAILSLGGIAIGWVNWAKQSMPKAPDSFDPQGGYKTGEGGAAQFNPTN
jgi:hypothetical protein